MQIWRRWKRWAQRAWGQVLVVWYAIRDPRTPWHAKVLAAAVVGYALSPIDLIPDVIPVLGALDDLILGPLGLALVMWLLPRDVLEASRAKAREHYHDRLGPHWIAGSVLLALVGSCALPRCMEGGAGMRRRLTWGAVVWASEGGTTQ